MAHYQTSSLPDISILGPLPCSTAIDSVSAETNMAYIPDRPCTERISEDQEPPFEVFDRPTLWRRLSEYSAPAQLPPPKASAKKRRNTYHPREDFTSAWLQLNNFKCEHNISAITENSEIDPEMGNDECDAEKRVEFKTISEGTDESEKHDFAERRDSAVSLDSAPDGCGDQEAQSLRWIDNSNAKNSVLVALSAFYALVLTIFALVLELSRLLSGTSKRLNEEKDFIFGMYMYGMSILFFLYLYAVLLLNPRWYKSVAKLKSFLYFHKSSSESEITCDGASTTGATVHRRVTHDSPSAGSLFLRLGSVVFGVIGIVYYSFSVFLCYSDSECDNVTALLDIGATVFVFTQMHFVFCNWKISITGSHFIARLGTMHLVAVNLWTWIRYVLIEEDIMEREIREIFNTDHHNHSPFGSSAEVTGRAPISHGSPHEERCEGAECILGSLAELMYTSIVEYSLIGAAVMFTVWKNIDHVRVPSVYVKRKHQIRVDCSKTTTGLFLGLAFLAATFTSMAVFYGYTLMNQNHTAAYVFGVTDIVQYVTAMVGCVYALWTMRQLRYNDGPHSSSANSQELLDKILLSLGMIGELIYSVAGLVGLTGDRAWQPLTVVLLFVHITRLTQVGLQSCLLYIAGKLRIQGDHELRTSQPGKQAITFLLIANIAMFLMNLFESEKAGVSETIVNFYGKKSWVFLVRSFSPLTIFYRFHSSVYFAEVWKNVYAWKG
uniref:Otopetrin n=1 Tax=Steinernema glaseri TaxID=37863 RepID=A0A1I8AA25_9BILA